jgi:hypothetical protein
MDFIITCPHCSEFVIIKKINCGIFRHGVFIKTGKQIPPHSNKNSCDKFVRNNLIYGCGKPYQIILDDDGNYKTIVCDYI